MGAGAGGVLAQYQNYGHGAADGSGGGAGLGQWYSSCIWWCLSLGLAGMLGWLPLPSGLHVLQHPAMLAGSGFMLFVEFFADKIPGVDSLWDMVHSVIRVPAGAALAAGVFGADSATMGSVAGLLGGALAATSFATKASTRAAVNTSPEPFSNIAVSLAEDGAVMGMMWLATNHPVAFGITLAIVLILSIWLLVVLVKYLKAIWRKLSGWFSR